MEASVENAMLQDLTQYCSFSNFYAMLLPFPPKEQTWREPRQHSEPVSD